jgi:hypothetical protein
MPLRWFVAVAFTALLVQRAGAGAADVKVYSKSCSRSGADPLAKATGDRTRHLQ